MTNITLAQLSLKQLKRTVAVREKIESLERELDLITGGHLSVASHDNSWTNYHEKSWKDPAI